MARSHMAMTWRTLVSHRWALVIVGAFVLLRVVSFAEPTWYSDEGTYANIGWALNHGARLYVDVWDNKPPGVYWFSAFLIGNLPVTIAMPLAATLLTAITAACVAMIGRILGGTRISTIATLAYVVVASLPNLHGNLFNAELCGAAAVALAVAVALRTTTSLRWKVMAGVLVGVAVLFKAVFAVDVVVVLGIPVIIALADGHRPLTAPNMKAALAILVGSALAVVAAVLVLLGQGVLGPAITVLTQHDVSYVAAYGSGTVSGVAGTLLTLIRVAVPIGVGIGLAVVLARRRHKTAALLVWWAGWDLAAAMVSARGFPHYVQQAEPVICLALAVALSAVWRRCGRRRLVAAATVVAAVITCEAVLWIPLAEIALADGRGLPGLIDDGVATSRVPAYYADGYRRVLDPATSPAFDALFPANLTLQRAAVQIFDSHSSPGDRVFVWGSIPWVYVLAERVPAGRYTALNSAYYVDSSAETTLLSDLEAHPPTVLVVEAHTTPKPLLDFLERHRYQRQAKGAAGNDYWLLVA